MICPICRNSVGSDSWSGFVDATAPILDTDLSEELIVPYNAAKWAEIYERQQKNGGIIDRNAEANKFLVDENTVKSRELQQQYGIMVEIYLRQSHFPQLCHK